MKFLAEKKNSCVYYSTKSSQFSLRIHLNNLVKIVEYANLIKKQFAKPVNMRENVRTWIKGACFVSLWHFVAVCGSLK